MGFRNISIINVLLVALVGFLGIETSTANSRPTINIQNPYFVVSENSTNGKVLTQLVATDPDGDTITFKTTADETSNTVSIEQAVRDPGTNKFRSNITLNTQLDVDNKPSRIDLYFSASDGKNKTPIKMTMIVSDVNDNPPSFTNLPYKTTLPENCPVGHNFYNFTAEDPDQGIGRSVIYSMEPSNLNDAALYQEMFSLDQAFGRVSLKKELDYETRTFYHLKVSAKDEGDPQCPGVDCLCKPKPNDDNYCAGEEVDFFITVTDVEDTPPIFDKPSYSISVLEDKQINDEVLTVHAKDGDLAVETPSTIHYSLSSDDNLPFSIDPDSGNISVSDKLDANGSGYSFYVIATEGNGANTSAPVDITVTDVNDNPPIINGTQFFGSVPENTPRGVPIVINSTIDVSDKDQGANSKFKIFAETMDGQPELDFTTIPGKDQTLQDFSSVTVTVNNATNLDFETKKTFTFKLIAREVVDTGLLGPKSSEATVTIELTDMNDNSPQFEGDTPGTVYDVSEDAAVGHVIHTFEAKDKDSGGFGRVVYSMEGNEHFSMSSDGNLNVAKSLDRELQSSYYIVVTAADNPGDPSQQRKSQLRVTVKVTDANDNPPEWSTSKTSFSVPETEKVNSTVAILRASDDDVGINAELDFGVEQNTTGSDHFGVKPLQDGQAELYVSQSLKGKPGEYKVYVVATDRGNETKESTLLVTVTVTDINLDPPVFIQPNESNYNMTAREIANISIWEDEPLDTVLYTLIATDEGIGKDDRVTYSLVPSSNNDYKTFRVSRNGNITALIELDREAKASYEITVKAEDNGLPASLSKTFPLRFILLDKNDTDPVYSRDVTMPQEMSVTENTSDARIGRVLSATDADVIDQICYYLCEGQSSSPHLHLDKHNGDLSLVGMVDREKNEEFNVKILASSECESKPSTNCTVHTNSMLDIRVNVDDVDDNPPKFKYSQYSRSVSSDADVDTEVISLQNQVHDKDIAPNNKADFSLLKISLSHDMAATFSRGKNAFTVEKTGSLRTNMLFTGKMVGYFIVKVEVHGAVNPDFKDVTEVKIYIVSDEQRVRLVFPYTPDYVKGEIDTLALKLSNVLDLNITVGAIKTHVKNDKTQDPSKTDAFIYATEKDSEEIMSAIQLQNALDLNDGARQLLFTYRVQEALGSTQEEEDEDEVLTRLFVILMTVMAILVIALVLVLVNIIRMYRRRLRAATTMAYVSPKQQEMYEHPGTNKYYTAENPLFGKEIKAPELEEDRNSTNSLDINAVDQNSPSKASQENVDPEEEQEVVLQIVDSSLSSPQHENLSNQNARLNKVLEEYENSVLGQNGVKNKPPPPPPVPHMNGIGGGQQVKGHAIPGLGQDVQEAVTRFSDEDGKNRPKNYVFPETIHEISTNHGNLEYTEI